MAKVKSWDDEEVQRYEVVRYHVTAGREVHIFHSVEDATTFSNEHSLVTTLTKHVEHMPKGWKPR